MIFDAHYFLPVYGCDKEILKLGIIVLEIMYFIKAEVKFIALWPYHKNFGGSGQFVLPKLWWGSGAWERFKKKNFRLDSAWLGRIKQPNLYDSIEARNSVDFGRLGDEFALDLVPHGLDGVGVRTDEGDFLSRLLEWN